MFGKDHFYIYIYKCAIYYVHSAFHYSHFILFLRIAMYVLRVCLIVNICAYLSHSIFNNITQSLNVVLLNCNFLVRFSESVRNLSQKFLDRPLHPIDAANHWIEYVIKYGSDSLRSPAMDLYWWQLHFLDVIAFLLLCAIIVIIVIRFFVRLLLQMINDNRNSSHTKKTN